MNPIRKHLQEIRTGRRTSEFQTFNLSESLTSGSLPDYGFEEYRFEARFGLVCSISEERPILQSKDEILSSVKENAIRKVNNELYGNIREQLYDLRLELTRRNLPHIANAVSKIIDETL